MKKIWGILFVCFFIWIIIGKETIGGFVSDTVIYVLESESGGRKTVQISQSYQKPHNLIIGDKVRLKRSRLGDMDIERVE